MSFPFRFRDRLLADPRHYQIATLSCLLLWGLLGLGFDLTPRRVLSILGAALATQLACTRLWRLPAFDPRSPLISGLSLCLLLRTGSESLAVLGAMLAIASKFVLRRKGRHVFNPTNFALVVLLLFGDEAWVSPGQWGSTAYFAFLMACLGGLVIHRAARSDVTYAFLVIHAALLAARAAWLGDPWAIPLHQLHNGALLLFAFFMISDPKTTPDTRAGRILFALVVALGAFLVQFVLFRTNGLLWSLALGSTTVPLINRLLPGDRYQWPGAAPPGVARSQRSLVMQRWTTAATCLALLLLPLRAEAFCGFYVARADTKLFNRASQVVLVRDGDRTVITMASDYRGEPAEFALVVPVPTFLTEEQIHVADPALVEHLDAYTSPRLVEYFDADPCAPRREYAMLKSAVAEDAAPAQVGRLRRDGLGVTVEAEYSVGEYEILILSATESRGLETWLRQNGYRIPDGAHRVLGSYIKQGMRFFVARVDLAEQARLGFRYLRPLQVAYESPKFMLPIRLGTVNADGEQELFVYVLTRSGRVETTNYRTVRLESGMDVPVFVKQEFGDFYRDLFARQVERERGRAVLLEYAWNMAWCDPCAADPLSAEQLRELGVFWVDRGRSRSAARPVFVTRLHVRYDGERFPEDLVFQQTGDTTNFQARYVLRHAFEGEASCPAGERYREELATRWQREASTLAELTGWSLDEIRERMRAEGTWADVVTEDRPWWRRIWDR